MKFSDVPQYNHFWKIEDKYPHVFEIVYSLKMAEENSEPSQTSKLELFAKLTNGLQPLIIFTRRFLDIRLASENSSEQG